MLAARGESTAGQGPAGEAVGADRAILGRRPELRLLGKPLLAAPQPRGGSLLPSWAAPLVPGQGLKLASRGPICLHLRQN